MDEQKIILRAAQYNWSPHSIEEWHYTTYELYNDGTLHIVVNYMAPVVDCKVVVSDDKMCDIQDILKEFNNGKHDEHVEACDGEGWRFVSYDDDGKMVHYKDNGYIYGILGLKRLTEILKGSVPEYADPNFSEEDFERYRGAYDRRFLEYMQLMDEQIIDEITGLLRRPFTQLDSEEVDNFCLLEE